jgi:hypothetical protein
MVGIFRQTRSTIMRVAIPESLAAPPCVVVPGPDQHVGADDEPTALARDLLLERQRRVPERLSKLLGGALLPLVDPDRDQ